MVTFPYLIETGLGIFPLQPWNVVFLCNSLSSSFADGFCEWKPALDVAREITISRKSALCVC